MKRLIACLAAVALLGGCRDRAPPASAYRNWGDRLAVAVGLRGIGLVWPCMKKEGEIYEGEPVDRCFRMNPARRWTGLWRDEFEGSRFCPAPATECEYGTSGDVVWLDPERVTRKEPDAALYAVEFIGRRTAVKAITGTWVDRITNWSSIDSSR